MEAAACIYWASFIGGPGTTATGNQDAIYEPRQCGRNSREIQRRELGPWECAMPDTWLTMYCCHT